MFCQKCGNQINDNMLVCPYCRTSLQNNINNAHMPYNGCGQMQKKGKALGITSLIFGIVAVLLSCIYIGAILGIVAMIIGIIGIIKGNGTGMSIAGLILGFIALFIVCLVVFSEDSDIETIVPNTQIQSPAEEENKSEYDSEQQKETESKSQVESDGKNEEYSEKSDADLKQEFMESCQEFNYKKIARNPDDYVGQNFKVTVQVFSISEETWLKSAYMKAFTADEYGNYFNKMIFIFDEQDKESSQYVNVLEDDIITVYGTFEEMIESKNMLNGEKSKEIALHMKYAELISE